MSDQTPSPGAGAGDGATPEPRRKSGRGGGKGRGAVAHGPDPHRALPKNIDAEKGLLSSALLSPKDVLQLCVSKVSADHFTDPALREIFEVLRGRFADKGGVDYVMLSEALAAEGKLERVGGPALISELFTFVPTPANAAHYLDILHQKYILREIITACAEASARAYEQAEDAAELLDNVEQRIFDIGGSAIDAQEKTFHEQMIAVIDELEHRQDGPSGIVTGFSDLDNLTGGLQRTDMIIIAARPSMGKTALAMNIAEHVAVQGKKPVAVFSLEMSANQVAKRLLFSRARVNLSKSRDGLLDELEFKRIMDAISQLHEAKIFIDDTAGLSIMELRAKARRLKLKHGIELVIVDYLQLLTSKSSRAQENRQQEISEISQGIKGMAKELDIPVIILSQLNRQPEGRGGGKPRMSDLRESGSIEQDADLVSLLVRPEVYEEDEERKRNCEGEAELIIAKHRNGPTDTVKLTFLKELARFESRAHDN